MGCVGIPTDYRLKEDEGSVVPAALSSLMGRPVRPPHGSGSTIVAGAAALAKSWELLVLAEQDQMPDPPSGKPGAFRQQRSL